MPVVGGRRRDALGHLGEVGVGRSVAVVVQIVELADAREAGLQHLDIELRCDRLDLVRRHRQREAVHHLAPAPETVGRRAAQFGQPGHAALEGVAVQVGHAGSTIAWRSSPAAAQRRARRRRSRPSGERDPHIVVPSRRPAAPVPKIAVTVIGSAVLRQALAVRFNMYIHNRRPIETEKMMALSRSRCDRALAQCAACDAGRSAAGPRHRRTRRDRRARRAHRLCRPGRRTALGAADGAETHRLRGPLDHARPDRLPHPSRPCRQPRQRVRDAAGRREL